MRTAYRTALAAALALGLCAGAAADPASTSGTTAPSPASAQSGPQIPTDPMGFTNYVVPILQSRLNRLTLTVIEPLTLRVQRDHAASWSAGQVVIGGLYKDCLNFKDKCPAFIDELADNLAAIDNPLPKAVAANLWAMVVPETQYKAIGRPVGWPWVTEHPIGRRIAGDLFAVCMLDRTVKSAVLTEFSLGDLDLTKDKAVDRCIQNTLDTLPQDFAQSVGDLKTNDTGTLSGLYEALLMLSHDGWAPLSERFGGELLVAVPDGATILYGHGLGSAAQLARRAEELSKRAEGETPPAVLRWTTAGWDAVPIAPEMAVASTRAPLQDRAFTDYFAAALAKRIPNDRFESAGRLVIKVTRPDGQDAVIHVENAFRKCETWPATCESTIDRHAGSYALLLSSPQREDLGIALQWGHLGYTGVYLETVNWDMHPIGRHVFGDLWERCVKHPPRFTVDATDFDRNDFNLSQDDFVALCERDTHARLSLPRRDAGVPADGIVSLSGTDEAATLLFLQDWTAVAAQFGGDLIVSVPSRDLVLFARGGSQSAIDAFAARTNTEFAKTDLDHAVSRDVFRWSPGGFSQITSRRPYDPP